MISPLITCKLIKMEINHPGAIKIINLKKIKLIKILENINNQILLPNKPEIS